MFELAIEGAAVYAENLCGQRLIATQDLQRVQDVAALDLVNRYELRSIGAGQDQLRRPMIADLVGEIIKTELVIGGQRHRALDAVVKLADVAGPGICEQSLSGFGRDPHHMLGESRRAVLQKVLREQQHVPASAAQRRKAPCPCRSRQ